MSWLFKRLNRIAALGGIVGVEVAGRARNVDASPAGKLAHAPHQIDGRDDRPVLAMELGKSRDAGRLPLPPEPDRVRRRFSRLDPGLVHRVADEYRT